MGPSVDHVQSVQLGGALVPTIDTLQMAHMKCNARRGRRDQNANRKGDHARQFLCCSQIPSPAHSSRHTPKRSRNVNQSARFRPGSVRSALDRAASGRHARDGEPPHAMTLPHPDAVGSYGWQAVDWVRREMGVELRWFQQLSMVRQLEHDRDGALVWRSVVESTPRRVGKSVRLRCLCCWRVAHADLFGEPQTVLLHRRRICRSARRSTARRGCGRRPAAGRCGAAWGSRRLSDRPGGRLGRRRDRRASPSSAAATSTT